MIVLLLLLRKLLFGVIEFVFPFTNFVSTVFIMIRVSFLLKMVGVIHLFMRWTVTNLVRYTI